jgi:hypothetical protein
MRLLSAVHPTTNQKRVLAKILAAPTPTVAGEEISKDANLVAARNMLMKLGVITFANNEATLTDRGQQIAVDENIADQSGQLTQVGQQLAYTNAQNQQDGDQAGAPPQQPEAPAPDAGGMPSLESHSLLKHLLS